MLGRARAQTRLRYPLTDPFAGATYRLDFRTESLTPLVGTTGPTVTRALNTATRVNSSGVIEVVNANLPRFDYDPVTLACKGLLIEEARTNVAIRSQDFSTGWTAYSGSLSSPAVVAPDGVASCGMFTTSASSGGFYQSVVGGSTSGTTYTKSVYAKAGTSSTLVFKCQATAEVYRPTFNLSTGVVSGATGSGSATITAVGNGWYRCTATFTATANGSLTVEYIVSGGVGSTVYVWGAQAETGAFATSYIPTTTAAVTRNADVCSVATANIPSFSATEGTVFGDFMGPPAVAGVLSLDDGTVNNRIISQMSSTTAPSMRVLTANVEQALITGTTTALSSTRLAAAWLANDFGCGVNGALSGTDTSGTVPAGMTTLRIGSNVVSAALMNSHISSLAYWPTRLSNDRLQVLSR